MNNLKGEYKMPTVSTFIYCESTNKPSQPNEKLIVNNPYSIIRPPYLPTVFSFSIVMHILDLDFDKESHSMKLIFKKKDSESVIIDTNNIHLPAKPKELQSINLPKEAQGININMEFLNVDLKESGFYVTEVYIDEEKIGSYPIYIKEAD